MTASQDDQLGGRIVRIPAGVAVTSVDSGKPRKLREPMVTVAEAHLRDEGLLWIKRPSGADATVPVVDVEVYDHDHAHTPREGRRSAGGSPIRGWGSAGRYTSVQCSCGWTTSGNHRAGEARRSWRQHLQAVVQVELWRRHGAQGLRVRRPDDQFDDGAPVDSFDQALAVVADVPKHDRYLITARSDELGVDGTAAFVLFMMLPDYLQQR